MSYDADFFEEEGRVAKAAAEEVVPWVLDHSFPDSLPCVVDVGCGTGQWAAEFAANGCSVMGVDLNVPWDLTEVGVLRVDLIRGYDCIGYDLAICLEVAEHLPPESATPLVAGLAQAGAVLWSAATPGQPGVGHINCQEPSYWAELFAQHGMTGTFIGDNFDEPVADFYRRNLYLYQ